MCGIVGYTGSRDAAPILLEGLKKLEYRGYDSAGIATGQEEHITISKVTGRIAALAEKTKDGTLLPGTTGIGHTRWATHGAPTESNAHPHTSNDSRFAVVHNGIIENFLELREELLEKGCRFESETDTEVIVHLVQLYYRGDLKEAVMRTSARLQGSYALGILCADETDKILVLREASPLILGVGIGETFFASDVTALAAHTRSAIYLEDGEFAELTPGAIKIFDRAGRHIQKEICPITWDIQAAEKSGYEHFMLKEILEQPQAARDAMASRIKDGRIALDGMDIDLKNVRKILITACGSAYYAGCAARFAIERLCRIPVTTELASELRYSDPLIDEHTLLIVLSQSGETADTIAALRECKKRGAKTLAVINVVGSTIARLADHCLYTWAGPEIAVATTKGYTTQLIVLYLFALWGAGKLDTIPEAEYCKHLHTLKKLPDLMREALDMNPMIPMLAKNYQNAQSVFFLGRNTDYAVALEGALKMKEISYIHAESYAAGELKHGTIALIHEGQPVIALCCCEGVKEKTMSNIVEVRSRGGSVLAVAFRDDQKILSLLDDVLFIPSVDPLFSAAVEIIPLQLLAYYTAKEKGCDIDKPRNLAKSVTVE